ncbi:ABC transporter substrate-binding protein [Roseinatronobacter alkalisoli]|uniref:Sugar ABC transporter substrate-binding protein n=1 Tax=Roseinatronobacter alkalisoli TaxID=3028235 RepID=A0ABT5TGQ9_9RHOB|nr:sugar ABC transporter substrate-binding protein [Roseinatronobacter sp. HJB301]MDD7973546.1 sugar ABC transporter substrate-binding protein [Roseinatronobacter sp. HJB301]
MQVKTFLLGTVFCTLAVQAHAQDEMACKGQVSSLNVIGQGMPAVTELSNRLSEFNAKWDTEVRITLLGENERRARARLDASTGAGSYHVMYVDEANLAEYVSAGWVYPLADVVPESYDLADFRTDLRNVATIDGTQYFAPFVGGGDVMMYRKDLLEEAGLEVPRTLDDMVAAIKLLDAADNRAHGWAARGQRGSGMNVWRWTPFFRALGGEWIDDGMPAFNSPAGVAATELYKDLMAYAPPGIATFNWSDSVEAFRSGQVAILIESDVFGPWMEDVAKSSVVGKVGYAPPPDPLPSAGWAHGWAVSTVGAAEGCIQVVAGDFVGWATSKEMEQQRLEAGIASDIGRVSTLQSDAFKALVPQEYIDALLETGPKTDLLIMASPVWPEIGDTLGLALEEIFAGTRTDVQAVLDEAAFFAEDSLAGLK